MRTASLLRRRYTPSRCMMAWQRRGREDATGSRDAIVLIKVAKVVVTTKCTQIWCTKRNTDKSK